MSRAKWQRTACLPVCLPLPCIKTGHICTNDDSLDEVDLCTACRHEDLGELLLTKRTQLERRNPLAAAATRFRCASPAWVACDTL